MVHLRCRWCHRISNYHAKTNRFLTSAQTVGLSDVGQILELRDSDKDVMRVCKKKSRKKFRKSFCEEIDDFVGLLAKR